MSRPRTACQVAGAGAGSAPLEPVLPRPGRGRHSLSRRVPGPPVRRADSRPSGCRRCAIL